MSLYVRRNHISFDTLVEFQKSCRSCSSIDFLEVLDYGNQPLANSLENSFGECTTFPLKFRICENCFLGQLSHFVNPRVVFRQYKYLSSTSNLWLEHCRKYAFDVSSKLDLDGNSRVVEVASNDGYLLQFLRDLGIQILGIEPSSTVAAKAIAKGLPTLIEFLSLAVAKQVTSKHGKFNLVVANNVLAHVPDIKDFAAGLVELCDLNGVITIENPTILNLLRFGQFDTVYHEHYSYLSLRSVSFLFESLGMEVFDVEELNTHGGSLRYWIAHKGSKEIQPIVGQMLHRESLVDMKKLILEFRLKVATTLREFQQWILKTKSDGRRIIGFGAAAKTTVLLNLLGTFSTNIDFVIDSNKEKQGLYIPGVNIRIISPEELLDFSSSEIIIFPWNLTSELIRSIRKNSRHEHRIWCLYPNLAMVENE